MPAGYKQSGRGHWYSGSTFSRGAGHVNDVKTDVVHATLHERRIGPFHIRSRKAQLGLGSARQLQAAGFLIYLTASPFPPSNYSLP